MTVKQDHASDEFQVTYTRAFRYINT